MRNRPLDAVLAPDRMTVVGAADDVAAPGGVDIRQLDTGSIGERDVTDWLASTDLAVVTDASRIRDSVETLLEGGVSAILVTAAVDREAWDAVRHRAAETDTPLLGPDALLAAPSRGLRVNVSEPLEAGGSAIVGEDPLTIRSLLVEARTREIGVSTVLATGTRGTVSAADLLRSVERDEETTVVLAAPDRIDRSFYEAAVTLPPSIALAVTAPDRACIEDPFDAASIGPIAPARVRDSVLEQAGALRVDSVDRLLDLAPALAEQPLPEGDDVVVVSNAGGPGVMATDAVGVSRLSMADFADETVERLEAAIPDRANARNPLDLLADSDIAVFRDVLDAVLSDPGVAAAVVISAPNPLFTFEEIAEIVADARARHESPLVTALMGGESTSSAASLLRSVGIPNYFDPFQAVAVLSALADQRDAAERRRAASVDEPSIPVDSVRKSLESGDPAMDVLSAAGVGTGSPSDGVPLSVVATSIPELGPVVIAGHEEYAAVLDDVGLRVLPTTSEEIHSLLAELRAARVIEGARGTEPTDVDALVETIERIGALVTTLSGVQTVSATVVASSTGATVTSATLETDYQ